MSPLLLMENVLTALSPAFDHREKFDGGRTAERFASSERGTGDRHSRARIYR